MRAELVLAGGTLFEPGTDAPIPGDLAIADGRVIGTGDVDGLTGPDTERLDVTGRLVLPGFTDAHVHPGAAELEALQCNLIDGSTGEHYLELIRQFADRGPQQEWVTGGGWVEENFPAGAPAPGQLDSATGHRPAYLLNRDHHSAWVNAAALQVAGVTDSTPDPADGRLGRDTAGALTGVLHEGAMDLVAGVLPVPSAELLRRALLAAQSRLHAAGITGWQDAIVGRTSLLPDFFDSYRALDQDGLLTARVVGALWWERRRGIEQLACLQERRKLAATGRRFAATAVKMMLDGVCESRTAALLAPYLMPPGDRQQRENAGLSFFDPESLRQAVIAADAAGFQLHLHALGDRAVRDALDAVEAARTSNPSSTGRHQLAHLQLVHPDDVPRFGALGVAANAQALWACNDTAMTELTVPFLGPERSRRQYPFASIARAGGRLALGSDWPVSTPDPMAIVATAVTRVPVDDRGAAPFLPDERLSLAQALTAGTAGSAWLNGRTASLAPGSDADLVILDADPFAGPTDQIADRHAVGTLVDGEWVHRQC